MIGPTIDDDAQMDADLGPRNSGIERLCVVTREVRPVGEMIRFVAGPTGLVPDLKRKLPGRGVWVTGHRQAIEDAAKRGAFKRSLKADVKVPADLAEITERLLLRAALDALSIAYKAGDVLAGFAKVENAIAKQSLAALIHAADSGADGRAKLAAAVTRRGSAEMEKIEIVLTFTSAELDLALGRSNVVHAALLAGRPSETFLARRGELERFRMTELTGRKGNHAGEPQAAAELGSE